MEQKINFKESVLPPLLFIATLWLIHLFKIWSNLDLDYWGIYPRESIGLRGVIFAPLLHGDWEHLASNSVPFLVLATMTIYFYQRVALRAFIIIYFLSGVLVWSFARSGIFHIGLSYVVYGLVSFVFWTGVFRRSIRSIVADLITFSRGGSEVLEPVEVEGILELSIRMAEHAIRPHARIVRDYAEVRADGVIDLDVAKAGLATFEVDELGLDRVDRAILHALCERFGGGPVGLSNVAIAIAEDADTVESMYEPFLIQIGMLKRTPRGRVASPAAWAHLGLSMPTRLLSMFDGDEDDRGPGDRTLFG